MTLRSAWPRFSAALLVAAAIYSSGGCSFFYDLNTTQCEVTGDCRAFGPQFATTICVNRVCVEMAASGTGGTTSTGGTGNRGGNGGTGKGGTETSGGEVGEGGLVGTGGTVGGGAEGGMGGEGGGVAPPECTTNTECIEANLDLPYICRNGKCVELLSEQCPVLLPSNNTLAILKDDIPPIIVGGFATMDNAQAPEDTKAVINWDMAFDEFDTVLSVGSRPRLLGLICQGYAPMLELEPSMAHLTQDVGTPGILSTLSTDALAGAWDYTQTTEYADSGAPPVLFMSTGSADLRLANLDDGGLVWHLLGDPRVLAATTASLLTRIEPRVQVVRETFNPDPSANPTLEDPALPLRVTLVSVDDPTMTDIASVLATFDDMHPETMLKFNALSAIDPGNSGNFRQVTVQSAKYHQVPAVDNGIDDILQNPPHIIVGMATGEFPSMISTIEANWGKAGRGAATQGKPRPFYVLSHSVYTAALQLAQPMGVYAGTTPVPLNLRSVGVTYALAQDDRSKGLYNAYLNKLQSRYQGTLNIAGTENHYDGAYGLLYAVMASAPFTMNKPDGTDLRNGWQQRVIEPSGASVNIGQTPINDTVIKLSSSSYKMALWGTMGPPKFDFLSGTRTSATSAWCMQLKSGSTTEWEVQIDGLIYDPTTRTFTNPTAGVPTCLQQY